MLPSMYNEKVDKDPEIDLNYLDTETGVSFLGKK